MSGENAAILTSLASSFTMTILRFPIAYAVALPPVFCLLYQGFPLATICQQMIKGIGTFSLMTVPFFIVMGCLMGSGGISEKLIALVNACAGQMRGGTVMVNAVVSCFFGGTPGPAAADMVSIGSILIPTMVEQGYDDGSSTAVTITSSREDLLVPPSHNTAIHVTTAGGISVGSLFLAGYIPGALLAVSPMVGFYIISVKCNYPKGNKFSTANLLKQPGVSFWALVAVLIVVMGVVGGAFAATESAATAVIYSLVASVFIYKGFGWKDVWGVTGEYVETLSVVLTLVFISSIFGYCPIRLHAPIMAASAITGPTNSPVILALLLNPVPLVLGYTMGMAPIILIATPILMPTATPIGIDPIQFGIMMVLNCGIGLLTPPVGAVLFIGSAVPEVPIGRVVKAILPLYPYMIITLLLITFIPAISPWLSQVLP